jgi:hypothetical protein
MQLAAAIERKAAAREVAQATLPEPPAAISFLPGERPPAWCDVDAERDVDGRPMWFPGDPNFRTTPRMIARASHLEEVVTCLDGRTTAAKGAKRMLPIARAYWFARDEAIERSGYIAARDDAYKLASRVDRLATLIFKCETRTYAGLAVKARALLTAMSADSVNDYIAHRAKVMFAAPLAGDVLQLAQAS